MRGLGVSCFRVAIGLPKHTIGCRPTQLAKDTFQTTRPPASALRTRASSAAERPPIIGGTKFKTPSQSADVYKAKQSLGQNFLVDSNIARKIVSSLEDPSEGGKCVVEVGPGKGALTGLLLTQYPHMTAVEIDQRSVEYLAAQLPTLQVLHKSVLDVDWNALALQAGPDQQLSVIGNLPYYITSQILFSVIDAAPFVRRAIVTMQLEVAERVCASPGSRTYGILSVVAQLYGRPRILFQIPPSAFQPKPDVTSALVCVDFPAARPVLGVNECHLRSVLRAAFQQRRKMLRQSLKKLNPLLAERARAGRTGEGVAMVALPEELGTRRPEELTPAEFVGLTRALFGPGETPSGVAVWRGALEDDARG